MVADVIRSFTAFVSTQAENNSLVASQALKTGSLSPVTVGRGRWFGV